MLFRFIVLLLNWFALYLSYYGITVSSGALPGSVGVLLALVAVY
jgi:hypothetical protein